jgi:hypothetical protein
MSQEVNVLPSDGRYPHEQFQCLLVAHCLVAVQYPGEQNGVVGNHDIRNQASALVADRDIQVGDLTTRGIGFQVLTGHGASINTATPEGKLVFDIFAALAEFERELVSERTKVGLASARARGRKGGGQYKMTAAKLRLAMAAMGQRKTVVSELCRELGVTRQTLYRHLGPDGSLREDGQKILQR